MIYLIFYNDGISSALIIKQKVNAFILIHYTFSLHRKIWRIGRGGLGKDLRRSGVFFNVRLVKKGT